jgi:cobalt-zinc-cadmium efflux system membrane fusion protein
VEMLRRAENLAMERVSMKTMLMLAACLGICGQKAHAGEFPQMPAPTENVVRLSAVSQEFAGIRFATVTSHPGKCVLKAMGKLLAPPTQTAVVSYAYPARVAEIRTQVGAWVEKGQTLLLLESQAVGEAKSEFFKCVAALDLARLNRDREKHLLDQGIGVKKGLVTAEAEFKLAEANLEAAEKSLHVLGFSEEQVQEISRKHEIHPTVALVAPIAGKVVNAEVVLGAMVDQATAIVTIVNPRRLWVEAGVYEKDLAKVKIGKKVEIVVPAYPDQVFHGTVTGIGDVVDEQTRTITVRSEVANDDLRLKPGMFADLSIMLNGDGPMVVVPAAAVLEDGAGKIVFVRQGDAFARRDVETHAIEGDEVQIVRGLKVGDEVVVQGNHQLKSELQRELLEAAHSH